MSTVGILGRTVLNTALGSRQGKEEYLYKTGLGAGWGGEQSRHRDSRGSGGQRGGRSAGLQL